MSDSLDGIQWNLRACSYPYCRKVISVIDLWPWASVNLSYRVMSVGKLLPMWFCRTQSQFLPASTDPSNNVTSCIACWALFSDTHFMEIRNCSENLHSCSVFSNFSVPFPRIARANMTTERGEFSPRLSYVPTPVLMGRMNVWLLVDSSVR